MKPDFSKIPDAPQKKFTKPAPSEGPVWLTPEKIDVKTVFSKADLEGLEHLNYAAGIPPFLRGPYSTM